VFDWRGNGGCHAFFMEIYFKKEIRSNPVRDSANNVIAFEACADDTGVLKLDSDADAKLVADLNALMVKRQGGVMGISAEIYDALKKKEPEQRRSQLPSFMQRVRVSDPPRNLFGRNQPAAVPAVPENNSAPTENIPPTRSAFLARTRKASDLNNVVKPHQ
jgi:hypothetical protein